MKIRFFNKAIPHRRFEYQPMYYNERKERLDIKKAHYEKINDGSITDNERREHLRDNLRDQWSASHVRSQHNRSSNIRILLLIGLILALGYFIFNGVDQVDTIVTKLW